MTEEELKECLEFLEYFGKDYSGDSIILNSGDNSIIMNPNTQWKKFLGVSIAGVAEAVAKELGKEIIWEKEWGYEDDEDYQ